MGKAMPASETTGSFSVGICWLKAHSRNAPQTTMLTASSGYAHSLVYHFIFFFFSLFIGCFVW